jgi:DNA repair exonuclease SbcCD ATPase subunit
MTVTDLLANRTYIEVALILFIIVFLLAVIILQRKTNQKIEERIEVLFDSTNKLKVKHHALSKKTSAFLTSSESTVSEIYSKIESLKASLDDTQNNVSKSAQAHERHSKRIEQKLSDFSKEIQKMKEYIREWAIDMEL